MIPIFFLWNGGKSKLGGTATFTVHLVRAFREMGHEVELFKVGERDETFQREFKMGVTSRTLCGDTARALPGPKIIACQASHQPELFNAIAQDGDIVVFHDRKQLSYTFEETLKEFKIKVVAIRECNTDVIPGSVFIPHPYVRWGKTLPHKYRAISLARIAPVKNTEMILQANLKLKNPIQMYGSISNEMITYHTFDDMYTELWRMNYKGPFPIEVNPCQVARLGEYNVDLTVMDGDGQGGSQYTFLETFDVGATLIAHRAWCKPGGVVDEGKTCLAVETVEELISLVDAPEVVKFDNSKVFEQFSPQNVIPQYLELLK